MQHNKKSKASNCCKQNCNRKATSYFTTQTTTSEYRHIAAEERLFLFHMIKHKHSFESMNCTSLVTKRLYEQKLTGGQTKCESVVVVNVLAPFAMQLILEKLKTFKYISLIMDTSDLRSLKVSACAGLIFYSKKGSSNQRD
jgi:hypothetical protein